MIVVVVADIVGAVVVVAAAVVVCLLLCYSAGVTVRLYYDRTRCVSPSVAGVPPQEQY